MLYPIEKFRVLFHTLHADYIGSFVTSHTKNQYVLIIIVDGFTKFIFLGLVKNVKLHNVTRALMNIVYLFGVPTRLVTDR